MIANFNPVCAYCNYYTLQLHQGKSVEQVKAEWIKLQTKPVEDPDSDEERERNSPVKVPPLTDYHKTTTVTGPDGSPPVVESGDGVPLLLTDDTTGFEDADAGPSSPHPPVGRLAVL